MCVCVCVCVCVCEKNPCCQHASIIVILIYQIYGKHASFHHLKKAQKKKKVKIKPSGRLRNPTGVNRGGLVKMFSTTLLVQIAQIPESLFRHPSLSTITLVSYLDSI